MLVVLHVSCSLLSPETKVLLMLLELEGTVVFLRRTEGQSIIGICRHAREYSGDSRYCMDNEIAVVCGDREGKTYYIFFKLSVDGPQFKI
jgi:hypothetical protein